MTTLLQEPAKRKRQKKKKKALVWAEILFLIAGFVALGWAGYTFTQGYLYNSWQSYKLDQTIKRAEPTVVGYLKSLVGIHDQPQQEARQPDSHPAPPEPPRPAPRKFRPNETIGRIEIPRVQVSAVIREGVDAKTLSRAAGHIPETPLPGQKGNAGIAAHRDTLFRGLRNIREGDTIRVITVDGAYIYQVDSLKIVWPKNVEVLDPTPEDRLTLVTCFPFNYVGSAPKRFIVAAKQIGREPPPTKDTIQTPGL